MYILFRKEKVGRENLGGVDSYLGSCVDKEGSLLYLQEVLTKLFQNGLYVRDEIQILDTNYMRIRRLKISKFSPKIYKGKATYDPYAEPEINKKITIEDVVLSFGKWENFTINYL